MSAIKLTKRQREVRDLLVTGLAHKQIAHRLGIGETTVGVHVYALRNLYRVKNDVELTLAVLEERRIESNRLGGELWRATLHALLVRYVRGQLPARGEMLADLDETTTDLFYALAALGPSEEGTPS